MAEDDKIGVGDRAVCPHYLVVLDRRLGNRTVRVIFAVGHGGTGVSGGEGSRGH